MASDNHTLLRCLSCCPKGQASITVMAEVQRFVKTSFQLDKLFCRKLWLLIVKPKSSWISGFQFFWWKVSTFHEPASPPPPVFWPVVSSLPTPHAQPQPSLKIKLCFRSLDWISKILAKTVTFWESCYQIEMGLLGWKCTRAVATRCADKTPVMHTLSFITSF